MARTEVSMSYVFMQFQNHCFSVKVHLKSALPIMHRDNKVFSYSATKCLLVTTAEVVVFPCVPA